MQDFLVGVGYKVSKNFLGGAYSYTPVGSTALCTSFYPLRLFLVASRAPRRLKISY